LSVVPPGEVAREVVVDATADGKRDEVVDGPPKLNPTEAGLSEFRFAKSDGAFGDAVFPKSPEKGPAVEDAGVAAVVLLLNKPENGLVFEGDGAVTLTLGVGVPVPNLIGVSGFQVLSIGDSVPSPGVLFRLAKGLLLLLPKLPPKILLAGGVDFPSPGFVVLPGVWFKLANGLLVLLLPPKLKMLPVLAFSFSSVGS
jgi:hypothetical protein